MRLPSGIYIKDYGDVEAILHTRTQWGLFIALVVGLIVFPLVGSSFWVSFIMLACISLITVFGLQILTGYCGQISLGQAAFVGVGAYAYANFVAKFGIPAPISLIGGGLVASLFGLVFGLAAVRVKGYYLAMTTLAAQFILTYAFLHSKAITNGFIGFSLPGIQLGGEVMSKTGYFYLIVGTTFILGLAAKNIRRTKWGRAFLAVRDNDLAAEAMGVNPVKTKLLAFAICCFFAGIAGGLWASYARLISPDHFTLTDSIFYLAMIIIGGLGSVTGAVFGTMFIKLLQEFVMRVTPVLADLIGGVPYLAVVLSLVIFGGVIVAFLIFEPRGLNHLWERFKAYYRMWPYPY